MDTIFVVSSILGFVSTSGIGVSPLLIAMGKLGHES